MRSLFAVLITVGALAADPTIPYERFELANGLELFVHEDRSTPIVAVNLWYRVGSKDEQPSRTGLAHLFEHLMFKGSRHVPDGVMDQLLEEAGGSNNATTSNDRTNYFESMPGNFLQLAMWIESDRLGWLLDGLDQAKLDNQRDVVRNERRQSMENRPYGMDETIIYENLFPEGHPYHWPVIGSHEDLQAASLEDVKAFFRRYYVPNNITMVISGDVNSLQAGQLVERWFGEIPRGAELPRRPERANPVLTSAKRVKHQDRVELGRLYIAWPTPPFYAPGDAELDILSHILAGGKASRLYKILVYEKRLAQDVGAMQQSMQLGSAFVITITAKPGKKLDAIERIVHGELARLRKQPPTAEELARAKNQIESAFFHRMEHVDAKADLLNQYRFYANEPGYLPRDLERYRRTTAQDVSRVAKEYLTNVSVTLETTPKTAGPGNSP